MGWISRNSYNGRNEKRIRLHPAQWDVFNSDEKIILAQAARASGKTSLAALWLVKKIQENPKGDFLLCAPTYKTLRMGLQKTFFELIDGTVLAGAKGVHNQNKEYTLRTGGKVYFRSLDDKGTGVLGLHPSAIVVDELGIIDRSTFDILCGCVAGDKPQILLLTARYTSGTWIEDAIISPFKNAVEGIYVREWGSLENPGAPHDFIKMQKRLLPSWRWEMLYGTKKLLPEGLVFPTFDCCLIDEPPDVEQLITDGGKFVGGIDVGGGPDPHVALSGIMDAEGTLWILYERYIGGSTRNRGVKQHSETIVDFGKELLRYDEEILTVSGNKVKWVMDHVQGNMLTEFRRLGLKIKNATKGPSSIMHGIDLVNARINGGKLKVLASNCPNLVNESRLYIYKPETAKPIDKHNHCMDALRYLCISFRKDKRMYKD